MPSSDRFGSGAGSRYRSYDRTEGILRQLLPAQARKRHVHRYPRIRPPAAGLVSGRSGVGAVSLMTRPFAAVSARATAATSRLTAVSTFLDGVRGSIVHGVPDEWRAKCLRECDGVDRLLGDGIRRWIGVESIPAAIADPL